MRKIMLGLGIALVTIVVTSSLLAPSASISINTRIAAPPAKVWAVLTDLPDYPAWNMQMRLTGALARGAIIENIVDPGPDQQVFWPTILAYTPPTDLLWRGHVLLWRRFWLPRLLDADHGFHLAAAPDNGTILTQSESFRGVLLWLWNPASLRPDFVAMNQALKGRAEQR